MKVLSAIGVMKGGSFNGSQFYHIVGEDENKEQFCIGFACKILYTDTVDKSFSRLTGIQAPKEEEIEVPQEVQQEAVEIPLEGDSPNAQ